MTNAVIFETNTLLDLKAITTFGINAKPNSESPIGFFGTGLKYAIAILCREGISPTIWIGPTRYQFFTKEEEFRNKAFSFVYMRKGNKHKWFQKDTQLPFTTELGKHWELWQAFRELYSNTLDEGGDVTRHDDHYTEHAVTSADTTLITVPGEAFAQEYFDMEKTFLPEACRDRSEHSDRVQYFLRPSNYIYYRGMRIMDLERPSAVTYNILAPIDITEDRTAKYTFQVADMIRNFIAGSNDEELISIALKASEDSYEGRLRYTDTYNTPSEVFADFVRKHRKLPKAQQGINPSAFEFAKIYDSDMRKEEIEELDIPEIGSCWRHDNGTLYEVLLIANEHATRYAVDDYPVTVIYQDHHNPERIWTKAFDEWYDSRTLVEDAYVARTASL